MASICLVCGKKPGFGNIVSHANNKTRTIFYPNVHKIRFKNKGQTSVKRGAVCTKCVKSGNIEKVL